VRVAAGGRLSGVHVDGSGGRFDTLDAAIVLEGAEAAVEGVHVDHAVFGILASRAPRSLVRGNEVEGGGDAALGMRGDAIRLWESPGSLVEGNLVRGGRDLVVWYSDACTVSGNEVRAGRYGTHLMHSDRVRVLSNRYAGNVVGIYVMYSGEVEVSGNTLEGSSGAAGIGLGLKESGGLRIVANRFLGDTTGVYVDTSPDRADGSNIFEKNIFRGSDAAVVFHGSEHGNVFRRNVFRDNGVPARAEGGSDAALNAWAENDFDDYAGYDLDGDGLGDVPYESRSLSDDLLSGHPDLAFLRGMPALALVDAVGRALPLAQPRVVVRDGSPRTGSAEPVPGEVEGAADAD